MVKKLIAGTVSLIVFAAIYVGIIIGFGFLLILLSKLKIGSFIAYIAFGSYNIENFNVWFLCIPAAAAGYTVAEKLSNKICGSTSPVVFTSILVILSQLVFLVINIIAFANNESPLGVIVTNIILIAFSIFYIKNRD